MTGSLTVHCLTLIWLCLTIIVRIIAGRLLYLSSLRAADPSSIGAAFLYKGATRSSRKPFAPPCWTTSRRGEAFGKFFFFLKGLPDVDYG
jgi:hypothetical protein